MGDALEVVSPTLELVAPLAQLFPSELARARRVEEGQDRAGEDANDEAHLQLPFQPMTLPLRPAFRDGHQTRGRDGADDRKEELCVADDSKGDASQLAEGLCAGRKGERQQAGLRERPRTAERRPNARRHPGRDEREDHDRRRHPLRARGSGEDREPAEAPGAIGDRVAERHSRDRRER